MTPIRRTRALSVAVVAMAAVQIGIAAGAAFGASGTATISPTPISGPAGNPIPVIGGGCVNANGVTHAARVFVRGPGAATTVVSQAAGTFLPPIGLLDVPSMPPGSFFALVPIPPDAATGSTYRVSAQCTEPGQAPGPESPGTVFTVTGPALPPAVGVATTGSTGSLTGVPAPPAGVGGAPATTGRATPIGRTPRFTG